MAQDGLAWMLEFADRMSEPATRIATALDKLDESLKKAQGDTEKLGHAQEEGAHHAKEHGESLFEEVFKAEYLKDKLEELEDKLKELGTEFIASAIEAADFGEHMHNALEVVTGSKEAADELMESAEAFALRAALPVDAILKDYQELTSAKIKGPDLDNLLTAASDLSKLGRVGMDELVHSFAGISNAGEMSGRSLMMLKQSGLDVEAMAHRLGAGDFRQLQEMLSKSPVDAATGLNAIMLTLQGMQHGTLGALTAKDADTVGGSIQRIKDGWTMMLESINEKPEWGEFRAGMAEIADLFNPATAEGKRFQEEVQAILVEAEHLFQDVIHNKGPIVEFFHEGAAAAKTLLGVIEPIAHFLSDHAGAGLGAAVGGAAAGPAGALAIGAAGAFSDAHRAVDARDAEYGVDTSSNRRNVMKFASGGVVSRPTEAIVGEGGETEVISPESKLRSIMAESGGGSGSGKSVVIQVAPGAIQITVPHAAKDPQEISEHLQEILPGAMLSWLDKVATEAGGA